MHEGGPKDLAWIAPDGSEVKEDAWHDTGSHTLGMFVAGDVKTHDDQQIHDDSFLLIVHAGAEPTEFTLPGVLYGNSFRRIVDTYEPARGDNTEFTNGDVLTMEPYSSVLLQISR